LGTKIIEELSQWEEKRDYKEKNKIALSFGTPGKRCLGF